MLLTVIVELPVLLIVNVLCADEFTVTVTVHGVNRIIRGASLSVTA